MGPFHSSLVLLGIDIPEGLKASQIRWRFHIHDLPCWLFIALLSMTSCKKDTETLENDRSYTWRIDSLVFDIPGIPPPDQVYMYSVWGSSPVDVWAVGHSDIPQGRIWHYNGARWRPAQGWPVSGVEGWINYPYAVIGFNATNVFVAAEKSFLDSSFAQVLRWNGSVWSEVPWIDGRAAPNGLGWIVKDGSMRLWGASASGLVVKYENGFLSSEPRFNSIPLGSYNIAALETGEVYVNARRDSLLGELPQGSITKLYQRLSSGDWVLAEEKFIQGGYEDGNGFALGVLGYGVHLFTTNRGLWEKSGNSWVLRLTTDGFGGHCFVSENDLWVYFQHTIWHNDGRGWKSVEAPVLSQFPIPGSFLFGAGWSNGTEIFISLHSLGKTYMLHGTSQ